jgi:2-polyprenyl-3-methyl-5-hydroxy-6-metoxy-1,4-benzoquinol methylase
MSLRRLQRTWNALGQEDPLWAVLSHRDKRGNRWDLEEFLATGREEIQAVLADARSLWPQLPRKQALDFGCGVGRLSQALAEHFDEVVGVDVAASMLEQARKLNRHGERCRYLLNEAADLSQFRDGEFDFIYSNITLQHMEPALAHGYIGELCRLLSPSGLLIFQLPGELTPGRLGLGVVRLRRALTLLVRRLRRKPRMDMFGTPPERVRELVAAAGGQVIEVQENTHAGPGWTSHRYAVVRSPSSPAS